MSTSIPLVNNSHTKKEGAGHLIRGGRPNSSGAGKSAQGIAPECRHPNEARQNGQKGSRVKREEASSEPGKQRKSS